ncbi:MAG TPA: mechanosensitive ion channel family protein [Rhizobacter sp.]
MTETWMDWFTTTTVLGVSVANLLSALLAAGLAYLVMTQAVRLTLKRLSKFAEHTEMRADDMLVKTLGSTNRGLMVVVSLLIGVSLLDLPDRWAGRVSQLWFVALALQIALWANTAVTLGLQQHAARHASPGTRSVSAAATLISWGLRTVLWSIVLLAMLSNLGVNVTAFIASLGVGGIAVALAAQNILGDLFASVAIAVDKPFEVGDFIVLGSVAGTVEVVGVKTTRIRSLGGEQIVMSNTEMLKQTISNYKRLQERRIVFGFGVTYQATPAQLREIPDIVKAIVQESEALRFDRAHFKAFGESSLDFEVVYFVLVPDYNQYMNEQQRINIRLKEELESREVEFAYPTRTVFVAAVEGLPAAQAQDAPEARAAGPAPSESSAPVHLHPTP